ncbi:hypothetical protein CAOG_05130 [Capsaspora owczarzaki ATCC 30864]|uniref:Uncharacterized protein n=1 Tax=Capsaspora owczarzaki (strain ATCC 30864) TaxID=595528 RepID=A0A0D2UHA7_CAPO3|nr:hypothetical protein CAOG_05130 [Capsaspora owczarzaki ATCC 30864]KJE94496.1 hypothetical protein CAOG_005130 [Capsaspora owczarzaki ATCC 30864]|eukprot:XP_004346815.1 hypothetical protein CAOG_05130 [Capsaspora owczarzaki ATCC 30864]
MKLLLVVLVALLGCAAIPTAFGAYCNGKPNPDAQPNTLPITTSAPVLVRSITNAKLFIAGQGDDQFNILHVWGSPYEMGYAHGSILKEEASEFVLAVWAYLVGQADSAINGTAHNLRPWMVDLIANFGLDAALDLTFDATNPYTGSYFLDEMHGLADATGLDYKMIRRVHMIGELTKGGCSMYGAWGKATASTGKLFQMRALDWDVDGPFKDYPQITVYHPSNSDNGHAFANIGWTGWLGSITGFSSVQTAISEIGATYSDASFGSDSRFGVPFTFLLRDILQFDQTIDDALNRITNAHRTCSLILGVGDGKLNEFRSVQYSYSVANIFDDQNMQPYNETWHPRIENIVYYGMDWLCPNYDIVLARQLTKHYGNITAEVTINDILPIVQTGDLHIAVYDLTEQLVHVAVAKRSTGTGAPLAYNRAFTRLSMTALFQEPAPTAAEHL